MELKQSLDALGKLLPAVALEEGEFLQKREKLLAFFKNTQLAARKWRETSQTLAQLSWVRQRWLKRFTQLKETNSNGYACFR